jgi:predicted DNA repair protein MutK
MFLVGGGIVVHGIPWLHHTVEHAVEWVRHGAGLGGVVGGLSGAVLNGLCGVVAGALVLGVVGGVKKWRGAGTGGSVH